MTLTDGLNDHGVHLVWTELEFVARETGMRETDIVASSYDQSHDYHMLTCETVPEPSHSFLTVADLHICIIPITT